MILHGAREEEGGDGPLEKGGEEERGEKGGAAMYALNFSLLFSTAGKILTRSVVDMLINIVDPFCLVKTKRKLALFHT